MPGALLDGEPASDSGALPEAATAGLGSRPFGVYVHVPFCASRCGYCDFNTYTASELGTDATRSSYAETVIGEIRLARRVLREAELPVETVFFGGGTPTLLSPDDLGRILDAIDAEFRLAPDAEVSIEANPESVDAASLARLRELGFTRMSFGMQSAREHVLRVLDRQHNPGRAQRAVAEARAAGFERLNLDLVYGTPGESDDDWRESLRAALSARPDHVSAYPLTVEDGTALAARIGRGELPSPDDDVLADRYLVAEQVLASAGFDWYEVSHWAAGSDAQCRHNLLYWTGADWWGIGPGAHSHVGSVRWWNVKHPAAYAARLAAAASPAQGREVLGRDERHLESVLLSVRLAAGCPLDDLTEAGRTRARRALASGLLRPDAYEHGRAALTLRGRLLADAVVRDLAE